MITTLQRTQFDVRNKILHVVQCVRCAVILYNGIPLNYGTYLFYCPKVRLTGGEPLVRKDILSIVSGLASVPGIDVVAMTTNGITLSRKLADLKQSGLTHLNVSLDTLVAKKFAFITRRNGQCDCFDNVHTVCAYVRDSFCCIKN